MSNSALLLILIELLINDVIAGLGQGQIAWLFNMVPNHMQVLLMAEAYCFQLCLKSFVCLPAILC